MLISILGIIAFQFYWLKENYDREKKALDIKASVIFQQTIQQLQVAKLKLNGIEPDSVHKRIKYLVEDDSTVKSSKPGLPHKGAFFSTINIIREKLRDSLKKNPGAKTQMFISINETGLSHDSLKFNGQIEATGENRLVQFLYGVDSLQDTLRLKEIDSAYHLAIKKENLDIPFSIQKTNSSQSSAEPTANEVTVGFAHPVTYKIRTGNTFPYLISRLSLPIFFSLLLLGITILAFVLLYRNMIKQRRLGELKNEFISNITHELKTPIATVGVAIEALKNFNAIHDPLRTKEYLDISSNELQRLNLLVDKVLKLSMFEKKEVELKYESVNLQQIVQEVVESLKLQFEKNGATVTVTSQGDLGLQGDQLHLVSVVFNLLDNAMKYVKDAPVIHIDMTGKDNTVELEVTDNGMGIAPEYRTKVFEKFFRIPHGDTHNAKGYGLGLSYAAQVIQKHQGSITIESHPGNGTKFIISLPKAHIF
jgi:two-component system phosphate regulon sensor histidine kinase PhoR